MVLLAEGLVLDELDPAGEDVARQAALARTSLNVLLMDVAQNDVATLELPPTPTQDRALQPSGLDALSAFARGALVRVFGTGEAAFDRLSSELSGYYVLGVEGAAGDGDAKRHRLDVSTRRRGLTLCSHRAFVTASTEARSAPPEQRLGDVLGSPFGVSDVPLRLTSFAFQNAANPARVRVLVSADVGQAGTPAAEYTVGFILFGGDGRVVASGTRPSTDSRMHPSSSSSPPSSNPVSTRSGLVSSTRTAAEGPSCATSRRGRRRASSSRVETCSSGTRRRPPARWRGPRSSHASTSHG